MPIFKRRRSDGHDAPGFSGASDDDLLSWSRDLHLSAADTDDGLDQARQGVLLPGLAGLPEVEADALVDAARAGEDVADRTGDDRTTVDGLEEGSVEGVTGPGDVAPPQPAPAVLPGQLSLDDVDLRDPSEPVGRRPALAHRTRPAVRLRRRHRVPEGEAARRSHPG